MSAEFDPYKTTALWLFLLVLPHINEFVYPTAPYLHHTYTIGIEEQFYLVWALLFRLLRRYFSFCMTLLLFTGIALNLCHYFFYDALNRTGWGIINKIATYYDYSQVTTFCIGSYLAIYYRSGHTSLRWFQNKAVQILFYIVFLVLVITNARLWFLKNEAMSGVVCCILLFATFKSTSLINYSYPLWEFLGKISYSVYLFHYVALVIVLRLLIVQLGLNMNNTGVFALAVILVLLAAILFGLIGYYTIESWFIKLKDRFSAAKK
jgi:peptidoglycan/LPS O-acetylase OafA/YrhL